MDRMFFTRWNLIEAANSQCGSLDQVHNLTTRAKATTTEQQTEFSITIYQQVCLLIASLRSVEHQQAAQWHSLGPGVTGWAACCLKPRAYAFLILVGERDGLLLSKFMAMGRLWIELRNPKASWIFMVSFVAFRCLMEAAIFEIWLQQIRQIVDVFGHGVRNGSLLARAAGLGMLWFVVVCRV